MVVFLHPLTRPTEAADDRAFRLLRVVRRGLAAAFAHVLQAVALAREVRPAIRRVKEAQFPSLFPPSECLARWTRIKRGESAWVIYAARVARILIV